MKDHVSQHPAQYMYPQYKGNNNSSLRCHHYERYGHIRTFCYRLYGYPQSHCQSRLNRKKGNKNQARKVWKPKVTSTSFIAHTYLRVSSREDRYFYNGCSRHMIEEKNYLKELKPYSNSYVTFGDEARGKIKGIGRLVYPSLPSLNDVLLIEGSTANLISISQLYYHGLNVNFNKSE